MLIYHNYREKEYYYSFCCVIGIQERSVHNIPIIYLPPFVPDVKKETDMDVLKLVSSLAYLLKSYSKPKRFLVEL